MKRKILLLCLALVVSSGASACGIIEKTQTASPVDEAPAADPPAPPAEATTEAPAEPATEGPDPCALVTKADAEKLAGTPLDPPVAIRETCSYTGPVTGPTAQVEIYVGDGAKKMYDIDVELGHAFDELDGIGDEAHREDGSVFFAKDGVWVAIRLVLLNDPAENREPLATAARTAAGRM